MRIKRLTMVLIGILVFFASSLEPRALSPAYAASKGNPLVAYWKFDEGGRKTIYLLNPIAIASRLSSSFWSSFDTFPNLRRITEWCRDGNGTRTMSPRFKAIANLFSRHLSDYKYHLQGYPKNQRTCLFQQAWRYPLQTVLLPEWQYVVLYAQADGSFSEVLNTHFHKLLQLRGPYFFTSLIKSTIPRYKCQEKAGKHVSLRDSEFPPVIARLTESAEAISEWFCSPAYAASKGNPPVAYWKFDEGGGTIAYDETANNNDGTLTNGPTWTKGKIGSAIKFDGVDDTIPIPTVISSYPFTVSLWATHDLSWNPAGTGTMDELLNMSIAGQRVSLGITDAWDANGEITLMYGGTNHWGAGKPSAVGSNDWHHITWVVYGSNDTNHKVYIDGVPQTMTNRGGAHGGVAGWNIGNNSQGSEGWPGKIDDVRIYNYARTQDQVLVDYNAGSAAHLGAGTDPNEGNPPVGYWKFDEGGGTTAYDRSGSGLDGTLTGSPTWTQGKFGSALSFTGSNYVGLGTNNALTNSITDLTISAWVKLDATLGLANTNYEVISNESYQNYGYLFRVEDTTSTATAGNIHFRFNQAGSTTYVTAPAKSYPNDHAWHHLAAVKSGTTGTFYLDGKQIYTANTLANPVNSSSITAIAGPGGQRWIGKIDEVKIYKEARTPAQIAYDYNRGKPVAQYKFDEGTGTIAKNEYSTADSGAAPVGWWRMDTASSGSANGTNNIIDSSGNAKHGSGNYGANATGMSWASGKIGPGSLSFDGVDDYVSIPDMKQTGDLTISCWFNQTASKYVQVFGSSVNSDADGEFAILVNASGYPVYTQWVAGAGDRPNITIGSSIAISYGQWNHVEGVYKKSIGTTYLYLNGVLVSTSSTVGYSTSWFGGIGTGGGASYWFNGSIDDVKVYDYARTSEQIYNDYKTTHGTLVGDTKFVDGKIGKALYFDGSGDYVDCGSDSNLDLGTGSATIEAWFKTSANGALVTKRAGSGFQVYVLSNKFYADGAGTAGVYSANNVNDGVWHYGAAVYDRGGSLLRLYVDGKVDNTVALGGTTLTDTANLNIGRKLLNGAGDYFTGTIDDVRIYNYARTADQIMQDYNAGAARIGAQSAGVADPWGGALPIAYWKLDENTGVLARDASGNGKDGTITNAVWAQGKNGPCLSFSGTNDKVQTADPILSGTGDFTISAWVNASGSTADTDYIAGNYGSGNGGGIEFYVYQTKLNCYIGAAVVGATALGPDIWYHVAVTRASGAIKLYVNGVQDGSGTLAGNIANSMNFAIGNGPDYTSEKFEGKIDDLKVYNYARTQAQIAWDYNRGKPIGHWKMDEATSGSAVGASTIKDNSGRGNHGTGSGSNLTWTTGKFGGALSFNGTNDYVDCGNGTGLNMGTAPFTVSFWAKPTGTINSGHDTIVGKKGGNWGDAGWLFRTPSSGTLNFHLGNGTTYNEISTSITNGVWQHVTGVRDGSIIYLYINGVLKTQQTNAIFASSMDNAVSLKMGWLGGWNYWAGQVDDVRIYNYTRTADQIQQDYLNGAAARLGD